MAMFNSFIFDTSKGETPETIARKRAIAAQIMGSMQPRSARNVGEGWGNALASIGQGITANVMNRRANAADREGQAGAGDLRSRLSEAVMNGGTIEPGASYLGGVPVGDVERAPLDQASNRVAQAHGDAASLSGDKQEFISALLPAAMEEAERTGIDPRIIVAQAAQETGWGRSAPGNNFFGIKSHGKGGGQQLKTHEYVNGQRVNVSDNFRTFGNPAESVRGYGDFILQNPRYKPLMEAQGLDGQLAALQASGYATDPNYSRSVGAIARSIPLPEMTSYAPEQQQPGALAASPFQSAGLPADSGKGDRLPMPANPMADPRNQLDLSTIPQGDSGAPYVDPVMSPQSAGYAPQGGLTGQVAPNDPGMWGMGMDPNNPASIPAMAGGTRDIVPSGAQGQFPAAPQSMPQQPQQQPMQAQGQGQGGFMNIPQNLLLEAISHPFLDEGTKAMARSVLEMQMQAQDPMRQMQLEKGQLEIEQLRNPRVEPTDTQRNLEWRAQQAGLQPGTQEYQQFMATGGKNDGVTVNNIMGGEKFGEEFAKSDAQALASVSEAGLAADRNIARIDRLGDLLSTIPTGAQANFRQIAANYGLRLGDDVDNIQAAQALINSLVPEQRPAGSGPMSDADLELFKQSLPRIINQPGGNTIIINTMRAIAEYDAQGAQIVQALRRGDVNRSEAFEALQRRANPLASLDDIKKPEEASEAPSGWEDEWEYLTPEERQQILQGR